VSVKFIRDPAKLWDALHSPDGAPAIPSVLMIDLNDASIRPVDMPGGTGAATSRASSTPRP